jgi:6-phosphogluconolactonase (cycloisomerase 2 family)
MQTHGWRASAVSTIAAAAVVCAGCSGYSAGTSGAADPAATSTYAYVVEENSISQGFSVAQYHISSDGTFTALNPGSVSINPYSFSLAADPSGKYLFADGAENDLTPGTILQFVIGSDGTLAPNSVPSVGTGNLPGTLVFTPNGYFAIAPNGDNTVSSYALSSTGSLSLINTVLAGFNPGPAVIDSTGQFAYVLAGGGGNSPAFTITEYTISSGGALNLVTTYPVDIIVGSGSADPGAMVVSPKGFLYLSEYTPSTNGSAPGAIVEFSINETNGGLSVLNTYSTADSSPGPVIFDPTGAYAYVNNADSLTISQYTVDASTGALTGNGPDVAGGIGPTHGIADPSGEFFYLVNQGGSNSTTPAISRFAINPDGTLAPDGMATTFVSGTYPTVIAIAQH